MPKEYAYIIDELLNTNYEFHDKRDHYENIISTIIDIDRAEDFIVAVCNLIKRMVVDLSLIHIFTWPPPGPPPVGWRPSPFRSSPRRL